MSLEEDKKLLHSVQNWQPPKSLHPIAAEALKIYEAAGNQMTDEATEALRAAIEAYSDKDEDQKALGEALEGVTRFMILLRDHLGDEAGAERVGDLIRDFAPRFAPFWEKVGEAMANLRTNARSLFKSFTGESAKSAAPAVDEAAPKGSVQLKDLGLGAGRPPPWVKK